MKRGTPDHPKAHDLAARLGLEKWGAAGVLETLWHFVAQYAKRGDIGRFSDDSIALAIGWKGASAELVGALLAAGWIEECACHRLRVHDWPQHADQTVSRSDEIKKRGFIECYKNTRAPLAPDERDTSQPSPKPLPLPLPNPSPSPDAASSGGAAAVAREQKLLEVARCPDCNASGTLRRSNGGEAWFCGTRLGGCNSRFPLGEQRILDQLSPRVQESIQQRVTRDAAVAAGREPEVATVPVDPAAAATWERVLERLAVEINGHSFATWLRPTSGFAIAPDCLRVAVPGPQFVGWLATNYSAAIDKAMQAEGLQGRRLELVHARVA